MAESGSQSTGCIRPVAMTTHSAVPEKPDHQTRSHDKLTIAVDSWNSSRDALEPPPLSPRSPRIKTNGLLLSPKKSMRERRLRVRSDPSKMLSERVQVYHGEDCGYKVACVQTESTLDGMMSPPITRHSSPIPDMGFRRSLSSSPDREEYRTPPPLPEKHEYRLKSSSSSTSSSSSSLRQRSQSADRFERTPHHTSRRRDKSESPDRRRTRSPVKMGCGVDRSKVSKVSRSTQTHRSIVKYATNNKTVSSTSVSSPPNTSPKPTIHVQLDDVLKTSQPDGPQADQSKTKPEQTSKVTVSAIKDFKPSRPGVTVISTVKGDKQSTEEQSITVIKCENIGKQSRKSKKSSKTKMTSSVSTKSRVQSPSDGEDQGSSAKSDSTVIYVPSRESRRLQVRPQMPAIAEDSQRYDGDDNDDTDMSSTLSSTHHKSIQYYGSLKTERTTTEEETVISASLSKSANDVTTEKQRNANSLLDTLHRKYYPKQYTPTMKTQSVELHTEPLVKGACESFVKMSQLYAHKNKLTGLRVQTGHTEMVVNGDQPSSPSPEETRGSQQEELFFECCEHVTPECDIKSFQKLMKTDKECAEIEAIEACKWLRAAGFPQYAQMYEENLFPVDVSIVERDHDFLDTDSMQSLFRRLNTLNKCVSMKIEAPSRKLGDESDEEDACALSDKWRYQRSSRRWSRKDLEDVVILPGSGPESHTEDKLRSCSSHDSVITDNEESLNQESPTLPPRTLDLSPSNQTSTSGQPSPIAFYTSGLSSDNSSDSAPLSPTAFKRSASEKFKIAKNSIFKRMESLKSRKGSVKNKQGKLGMGKLEIGSPVLVESRSVQERMDRLGCKDISPSTETSPNLSTGSRHTEGSEAHDVTADSDSVFIDAPTEEDVVCVNGHPDKRRNHSESAVSELLTTTEGYSTEMGAPANQRLQHHEVVNSDRENANTTSQYKYRSSSFSVTNHNQPHSNGYSRTHSDTHLEANNNIDKSEVMLRDTKDPLDPECRLSVYDNVQADPECGEAVRELDLIVQNLMQDISELNASWGLGNQGDGLDMFPMDLTLEEALQDVGSDKDSTLTRKSHSTMSNNKNLDAFATIPVQPAVRGGAASPRSTSTSSSTVSHSNGSVHHVQPQYDSLFDPSEIFTPSRVGGGLDSSHSCHDPDSSHVHVLGMDETLDAIIRNLESHYSASTVTNDNKQSHVDANKNVVMETEQDNTSLSNQELSDPDLTHDLTPGSREDEDEDEPHESRERRDSGVGSSLTREPSDRRRYRIRWHSFVKSHRPSFNSRDLQINVMSAGQLKLLRKFSLLKITALMEKYSLNRSGWNWAMPMNKLMRRFKVAADYKDRKVFGVPLQLIVQRTGQPLPQCMLHAMRCLRKNAHDSVGIFRKSGVRSRIQKLRDQIESDPELVAFDNLQAYDVADLLKQYFRELPECLLTNKLSETFINIFSHVPADQRLEALYSAVMLLPDENREVLQSLLLFLSDMADYAKQNQMNASNLAVCFAPSLFHLCGSRGTSASPKRNRKKEGIPDQRELQEQKAAHECLTEMIIKCKKIFMVPADTLRMCHFSYMDQCNPVSLSELGRRRPGEDSSETGHYSVYLESCIQGLLKESRDKFKGWVSVGSQAAVDLAYKKIDDGYSLRLWKCSVEIEAPPNEVLNRVCRERQLWDEDFLKWRVVETLDQNTEVFQYVLNNLAPHPTRDFCELRHWRTDLPKGACVLVSTSVEHHPGDTPLMGGVTGVVLASRYLIEPCGAGKSRLTHISRIDLRGHNPEWYNKVYGHLCANLICRIRDSFSQKTDGPETNV